MYESDETEGGALIWTPLNKTLR